eukprot:CAMPEP_0115876358 /NCGR_PEP_ID=MMETSP0287-20121206/25621_1 /TAXON_ID=412157 /ORGANISM="Chrysochromulina rotalis, Strain UIO044" /LENGTH=46 /DNA_ID= /DNA_START= /DNA_END= /DNA_ORIENTATION=
MIASRRASDRDELSSTYYDLVSLEYLADPHNGCAADWARAILCANR